MSGPPVPGSLVWATDIDVLPGDRVLTRRDDYLVVRSPGNPDHWWGNLLIFDDVPRAGDRRRWEAAFTAEFSDEPRVRHRCFAWDRTDDATGAADTEFISAGYERESQVGLIAEAGALRAHPRESRTVAVRTLDPDGDEALWAAVQEVQAAEDHPMQTDAESRAFLAARQAERRVLFAAGRGTWYVALTPDGEVAGSLGIIVTGPRGRFQHVSTAQAHRRQGVCSRLVVEAAAHAAATFAAERFVIAAEPDYHALGLYESLGFTRAEHVHGVMRPPPGADL